MKITQIAVAVAFIASTVSLAIPVEHQQANLPSEARGVGQSILVYDSEALHGRGMENSLSSHEKRTIGRAAAGTALAAIGAGMTGYFSWMMSKEGQEFMTSKEGQELLARGVDLGREHPHLNLKNIPDFGF